MSPWLIVIAAQALSDPAVAAEGIGAELIARPAGESGPAAAARLVEAEGLTPWNPAVPTTKFDPRTGVGYRARHAGDGREVVVYFAVAAPADRPARLCRIRRQRGGISAAHYRAIRWCFAGLGMTLPARPAPPVRQEGRPPAG